MVKCKLHDSPERRILREHGYTWAGMKLLNVDQAFKIVEAGGEVLALHSDNTENYIRSFGEVAMSVMYGDLFGVEFYLKRGTFKGKMVAIYA